MSKKWFVFRVLMSLLFIGLLIVGGILLYRLGWSQGYAEGQLAVSDGQPPVIPFPYRIGFFGPLLMLGLFLIGLIVIGKVLRFLAWALFGMPWMMAAGPGGRRWHARHYHKHAPPWCWGAGPEAKDKNDAQPAV